MIQHGVSTGGFGTEDTVEAGGSGSGGSGSSPGAKSTEGIVLGSSAGSEYGQGRGRRAADNEAMTVGRIMDWIEARVEAIKSRQEEEDEDDERERAGTLSKVKQMGDEKVDKVRTHEVRLQFFIQPTQSNKPHAAAPTSRCPQALAPIEQSQGMHFLATEPRFATTTRRHRLLPRSAITGSIAPFSYDIVTTISRPIAGLETPASCYDDA